MKTQSPDSVLGLLSNVMCWQSQSWLSIFNVASFPVEQEDKFDSNTQSGYQETTWVVQMRCCHRGQIRICWYRFSFIRFPLKVTVVINQTLKNVFCQLFEYEVCVSGGGGFYLKKITGI